MTRRELNAAAQRWRPVALTAAKKCMAEGRVAKCADSIRSMQVEMSTSYGSWAHAHTTATCDMGPVGPQAWDAAIRWARDAARAAVQAAGASYAEAVAASMAFTNAELRSGS